MTDKSKTNETCSLDQMVHLSMSVGLLNSQKNLSWVDEKIANQQPNEYPYFHKKAKRMLFCVVVVVVAARVRFTTQLTQS